MARGRMLNRTISRDKEVSQLVNEAGAEAGLAYTWLIAHLDREGRVDGDPDVIKGFLAPRIGCITAEIIGRMLATADRLGLIQWYESKGDKFVAFPKFRKNQKGLRINREPESDIPAPPRRQDAANMPPEGKGREENLTKGNGRELNSTEEERPKNLIGEPITKQDPHASEVLEVFNFWRSLHPDDFLTPHPGLREWIEIRKRIVQDGATVDRIKAAIQGMHADEWWQDKLDLLACVKDIGRVQKFEKAATTAPPPKKKYDPNDDGPRYYPTPTFDKYGRKTHIDGVPIPPEPEPDPAETQRLLDAMEPHEREKILGLMKLTREDKARMDADVAADKAREQRS